LSGFSNTMGFSGFAVEAWRTASWARRRFNWCGWTRARAKSACRWPRRRGTGSDDIMRPSSVRVQYARGTVMKKIRGSFSPKKIRSYQPWFCSAHPMISYFERSLYINIVIWSMLQYRLLINIFLARKSNGSLATRQDILSKRLAWFVVFAFPATIALEPAETKFMLTLIQKDFPQHGAV
jgi:hypothetical protein